MLDIAVVRGRVFTPAERTSNLSVAIVSETTARTLWPNADAVGQAMRLDPDLTSEPRRVDEPPLESRTFTVVGVVRDVAGFRIAPFNKAVVYVPTSAAMPKTSLIARVHGDPELARQTLLNRLTTIDPDMARQVLTMRTLARMDTYFLQIAFWLTVVLGGLALALTLSGLFSVLSYLVEQRTGRSACGWRSVRPREMSRGWSCRSRSGPSASASSSAAVQPPDWPRCCWPRRPPPPLARSFTSSIRSPTP